MQRDKLCTILEAAARRVLEDAAFIFTECVAEPFDATDWPSSVVLAQLPFTGPVQGSFSLAASAGLCGELAVDMLGVESGDAEAESNTEDVLREMVNMLAGMTLEEALGAMDMWELGIPETRTMLPVEYVAKPRSDVQVILRSEEEEPIEVAIFIAGSEK